MKTAMATLALAAIAAAAAGCLSPDPPDGAIRCSAQGRCPSSYECGPGGLCVRVGAVVDLAARPDGGASCADYCNCIGLSCTGGFADEGECLSVCGGLAQSAVECRVYHCGVARDDPTTHCPHALGREICP